MSRLKNGSIYFFNYILLIMLLQLSWFFPLCPSLPSTLHSLRQFPHHCSCPWVMHINSLATPFPILYFTSPWLFCNYLFVLPNPLTSHSFSHTSPPISLSLTFGILIMMCLEVDLFASSCLGLSVLLGFACLFPSPN